MFPYASNLSPFLLARLRPLQDAPPRADGKYVLYWTHHALRADESPALDVAILLANTLNIPLLVYAGLGGAHPYNNDRHHTFILQGARDLAVSLRTRNVTLVFCLPQHPPAPTSTLTLLARQAAAVITDDFPAPPFPKWTINLAARCPLTPVWAVDGQCIVPMQSLGTAYDRAFAFRDAAGKRFASAVTLPYPPPPVLLNTSAPLLPERVSPLTFKGLDISGLVAACKIDHSVPPIADSPGGSRAGYDRWNAFAEDGLRRYAARRTDATQRDGVSRLSPYLHYGMVSPFRIAREAALAARKPTFKEGAEKFLNELFTWREVSYNLCYYRHDDVQSLAILPAWAQTTLAEHEADPREHNYSLESLSRGQTDSRLWNAAQKSLLIHGELHNNLRMTWGKAIPTWTPTARKALAALLDLNNRFSLDGSDPNSYGGLLWCLGLYDRAFTPPRPIIGTVRPRPPADHQRRLDLITYERFALRPALTQPPRIAVIGAGLAGLAAARMLNDQGLDVTVFDKGRRPGGRASTRRESMDGAELHFDHGCQYLTFDDPRLAGSVLSWQQDGAIARWNPPRGCITIQAGLATPVPTPVCYVGIGGIRSFANHLAQGLTLRQEHEVTAITREANRPYQLTFQDGRTLGGYDSLIIALPAPQAARLLAPVSELLTSKALAAPFSPCWAAMLAVKQPVDVNFDVAWITPAPSAQPIEAPQPLSLMIRNSAKSGQKVAGIVSSPETWTLHASAAWSLAHLEEPKDLVATQLLAAASRVFETQGATGVPLEANIISCVVHRWRYARATARGSPNPTECYIDAAAAVALCGDWCGDHCGSGTDAQSAYLSGIAAAARIIALAQTTAHSSREAPVNGVT